MLAAILSLGAIRLLAKGDRRGWGLKLAGDLFWIGVAFSHAIWGQLFFSLCVSFYDIKGWLSWKKNLSKEQELAWAAGFFDGEGCFSARTGSHRDNRDGVTRTGRQIVASVSQKEPYAVLRFKRVLGFGKIYVGKSPTGKKQTYWCVWTQEEVKKTYLLLNRWLVPASKAKYKRAVSRYENWRKNDK